jgi:hypothetical protein
MTRVRPDDDSFYAGALLRHFMREEEKAGPKATAFGTLFRFSDAGICARQLGYKATVHGRGHGRAKGVHFPNEDAAQGIWTTNIGSIIHEHWQRAFFWQMGNNPDRVKFEVKGLIHGSDAQPLMSGHADAIVYEQGEHVEASVEVKSRNGTRYRRAVSKEGPSYESILQGGLNAMANMKEGDQPDVVVVYLSLENTTPGTAAKDGVPQNRRVVAQWTFPFEEWAPLVAAEVDRIDGINKLIKKGFLPERIIPDPSIPGRAVIDNPKTGHWSVEGWKKGGTTWQCRFCPFQQRCIEDGPGEIMLDPATRAR